MARRLLGCELIRTIDNIQHRVRIVETEAYDQNDPASHSFRGPTPRTEVMFGPAGHAYVYFTYGMHYCMNIVTGEEGQGEAVLIRAVEPLAQDIGPTNGPARLCKSLGIDRELNGHDLEILPLQLCLKPHLPDDQIIASRRIGITRGVDALRRFYVRDNPFVSRYTKRTGINGG